jgi:hypothetical protein
MGSWLTIEKVHEGFPLLLRRQTHLDVDSLRLSFPTLVVVTHEFAKSNSNGLPDPDYNDGLAGLDQDLVAAFGDMGVPVLVETFGGKRTYYFYVSADVDAPAVISSIAKRYPAEQVSWRVGSDPAWSFIRKFSSTLF